MKTIIKALLTIGLIARRHDGSIALPFRVPPRWLWQYYGWHWRTVVMFANFAGTWKPYVFRNLPGVVKWVPGRMLPRRWGIGWLGFEFGDRGW